MINIPLFFLLLISSFSFAEIHSLIPKDESRAILLLQGVDATMLYQAMEVDEVEDDSTRNKSVEFVSPYTGNLIFTLDCKKSKSVSNLGTCTLKVFNEIIYHTGPIINKERKFVLLGINDEYDATQLAKKFMRYVNHEIFRSEDNELRIWLTKKSSGSIGSFTIEYSGLR